MQINNTMDLDIACEYKIHEIIFINSGSNYYVRLPVDFHAALISDNNSGKTSSLSALKLFLLPEISFTKQKNKFSFHSGGKYYKDLSSYTYYFPGTESYIICNASNPKGRFCWVLYRTNNLGYERMAVPCEFNAFAHLFWDESSKKNENAGELQPQVGISEIKKKLTSSFNAKIFTDKKAIGDAIYTRTSNTDDDSRFCLMPMAKGYSSSNTETIRALLNMAFSLANASTTSLPTAIASILDGSGMSAIRKHKSEGIFLDLESQLEEWRELKNTDAKLKLITSQKEKWEHLQNARSEYERLRGRCVDHFKDIAWSLKAKKSGLDVKLQELRAKAEIAEKALETYLPIYQNAVTTHSDAKSAVKSASKSLASIDGRIARVNYSRSHLRALCPDDDKSDKAVLLVLDKQIDDCSQEIEGLNDQARGIQLMEKLDNRTKTEKIKRAQLSDALSALGSASSFLDDMHPESASKLLSLNQDFAALNVKPTFDEKSIIESFSALLSIDNGRLSFCGSPLMRTEYLERDGELIKQKYEKQIARCDDQIESDSRQLIQLRKNCELSKERQKIKLAECSDELAELKNQRSALLAADELKSLHTETQSTLVTANESLEKSTAELETGRARRDTLQSSCAIVNANITDHGLPLKHVEEQFSTLSRIEAASSRLLDLDQALLTFDYQRAINLSTEEAELALSDLQTELTRAQLKREDASSTMALLLEHGIVDSSPEDRYALTTSRDTFDAYYSDLQTVFLNLEKSKESYHERLVHHNNTAATAARMIENVESIVKNFVKGINDEISSYRISNLTAVELVAELHPQYTEMVKTLGRVGNRTDELLSETFYTQISDFQDQFFIKNPGKIDIERIIEKISYQFERNNTTEDTPQSNGTNCMVNAALLALLLKKMIPEDLNLTMPVVFDEVGSLDEKNFHEILKVMEEHRLYLFAANPEHNGVIASVLDVYHYLSVFRATDVLVQGKAEAIYYPGMEERLEDINSLEGSEIPSQGVPD